MGGGGGGFTWLAVVVAQVRSVGWQLSGQGAGLAAEAGVVFVGAELGFDDEAAVGEERIVRTARIHVHTLTVTNSQFSNIIGYFIH